MLHPFYLVLSFLSRLDFARRVEVYVSCSQSYKTLYARKLRLQSHNYQKIAFIYEFKVITYEFRVVIYEFRAFIRLAIDQMSLDHKQEQISRGEYEHPCFGLFGGHQKREKNVCCYPPSLIKLNKSNNSVWPHSPNFTPFLIGHAQSLFHLFKLTLKFLHQLYVKYVHIL